MDINFTFRAPTGSSRTNFLGKVVDLAESRLLGALENEDYGHAGILNQYCEVKRGTRIRGRIQHGWDIEHNGGIYYQNNYLKTFVWSQKSEDYARKIGWNNVYSIGSPWLYLEKVLSGDVLHDPQVVFEENRDIEELWVFGYHSTDWLDGLDSPLLRFLEKANQSHSRRKVVLLYYMDYDKLLTNDSATFPNLRIITLGQRRGSVTSDSFLLRLRLLLERTERIVCDFPSTVVLYGLSIGCAIEWIDGPNLEMAYKLAFASESHEALLILDDAVQNSVKVQAANACLGIESLKSPEELRVLFNW
jgi:hypothetical protein